MAPMKCPDCGSQHFYVKDPDDQYSIFEIVLEAGRIVFSDKETESDPVEVMEETETYCQRCAWHDRFKALKNVR